MTNDEYIQQVAQERGMSVERVMSEIISEYRYAHECDGSMMYDDAIALQCAANPRAVVSQFRTMLGAIVKELEQTYGHASTDDITHHPVFVMMSDKCQAMAGYGYRYSEAYRQVVKRASPETLKLWGIEPVKDEEAA